MSSRMRGLLFPLSMIRWWAPRSNALRCGGSNAGVYLRLQGVSSKTPYATNGLGGKMPQIEALIRGIR